MMRWARMSDFSITLPDRPGELARLGARLRAADVNLVGLWGYGGDGGGLARFYCVPEQAEQFRNFVESAELETTEGTTLFVSGDNDVGALVKTLETIAAGSINLRAIQSVAFGGEFGCFIWAEPSDWAELERVMGRLNDPT
ncbi:MAG: hypothetical protein HKO59_04060 [Phycisphaerales bacterium]|nr:hypothetical protein [Phycisphaerales bacterium]NNM25156.1 hypothetical protein [Phycisphaerales bacterium]